jgi:hypothetical protein
MTGVVWANVVLAIPFLIAFIAVPLWMTFRYPSTGADHTQAHSYLHAKAALAAVDVSAPGRVTSDARHDHRIAA